MDAEKQKEKKGKKTLSQVILLSLYGGIPMKMMGRGKEKSSKKLSQARERNVPDDIDTDTHNSPPLICLNRLGVTSSLR